MIIQNNDIILEKSNDFKNQEFGIKNISKVFKILIDGIYSDGEGSIMREIVSNAIDANKESNTTKNVEVNFISKDLLTGDDYTIIIKDYGLGISPERMFDIFCFLGESTKDGDNDYIGGFGIGSKSVFKYTDTYSVKTINNNIEYLYTLVLNDNNLPECNLIYDKLSSEKSYTEIIIPVKNNKDFEIFKEKAQQQLKWFENIDYKGVEVVKPDVIYEGKRIIILTDNSGTSKSKDYYTKSSKQDIIVGKIPYLYNDGINTKYLPDVVIKFEVGEIQPTASREDLNYNNTTQENFNRVFEEAKKELYDYVQTLTKETELFKLLYLCNKYHLTNFLYKNVLIDDLLKVNIRHYYMRYWRVNPVCEVNSIKGNINNIFKNLDSKVYYYDDDSILEKDVKDYSRTAQKSIFVLSKVSNSSDLNDLLKLSAIPLSSVITPNVKKPRKARLANHIKYKNINAQEESNISFDVFVSNFVGKSKPLILHVDNIKQNSITREYCYSIKVAKTNYDKLINLKNVFSCEDEKGYLKFLLDSNTNSLVRPIAAHIIGNKFNAFNNMETYSHSVNKYLRKLYNLRFINPRDLSCPEIAYNNTNVKKIVRTVENIIKSNHDLIMKKLVLDHSNNLTKKIYLNNNKK